MWTSWTLQPESPVMIFARWENARFMQLIGEQKSFQRTELSVRSVSYMEVNEDREVFRSLCYVPVLH